MGKLPQKYIDFINEIGLAHEVDCDTATARTYEKLLDDGKTLPDGVFYQNLPLNAVAEGEPSHRFYTFEQADFSYADIDRILQIELVKKTDTIKNCLIFFTVITSISLAGGIIYLITLFS